MPRKAKIPQEFLDFKETVQKTGLTVSIERKYDKTIWVATVLKGNKCIWHNDGNPKTLELNQFWESGAWKAYDKTLLKN